MRKFFFKAIIAVVAVSATTILSSAVTFADTTVSWTMTDQSKWYTDAEGKTVATYSSDKFGAGYRYNLSTTGEVLSYYASNYDTVTNDGLGMNNGGEIKNNAVTANKYTFSINDVPAGAVVSITAKSKKTGKTGDSDGKCMYTYLYSQWGTATAVDGSTESNPQKAASDSATFTITNTAENPQDLKFTFSQKAFVSSISYTVADNAEPTKISENLRLLSGDDYYAITAGKAYIVHGVESTANQLKLSEVNGTAVNAENVPVIDTIYTKVHFGDEDEISIEDSKYSKYKGFFAFTVDKPDNEAEFAANTLTWSVVE